MCIATWQETPTTRSGGGHDTVLCAPRYRPTCTTTRRRASGLGCHTPIPGPTRLADPNRVRGAIPCTGTLYLIFFFFLNRTGTYGYGPHLITESKYHIPIKRTTTEVVSIKIYTHLLSPIYKYKNVLLHLQIRARNLHVVNPYKCVGPTVYGSLQMSSLVPTRIKTRAKLYA